MRRLGWALAPAAVVVLAAPMAAAQNQSIITMVPFGGSATADRLADVESTVRGALIARGVRVPDRQSTNMALGVSPPTNALGLARAAQSMGSSHILTGSVQPLAGQYNLTLTIYEAGSGRSATQARNVGEQIAAETIAEMLDALLNPSALGPAPVDPEAQRRAEAERAQAEARAREAREAEARQRAAQEAEARRRAEAARRPVRGFADQGPIALGVSLHLGGLVSDGYAGSGMVLTGQRPSDPSSFAFALRFEGAYALEAVRGLELVAAMQGLFSPTSAFALGAGAQFTFPARASLPLRGTAGAVIGWWQGISGARATTVWLQPYVRAEWAFTPSVSAFAGVSMDVAPSDNGGVTTFAFTAGARMRFSTGQPVRPPPSDAQRTQP